MTTTPGYLDRSVGDWAESLKDANPLVRRLAAYALGEIGPEAEGAKAALSGALEDEAGFVRTWAAAALARVDPADPSAVAALAAATNDERAFVRSLAVWHLGRLRPDASALQGVLPALDRLLEDPDPSVRVEAALALKRLHQAQIGRASPARGP